MEVLGQGFLAAYTEGDNRDVVATDTMKNVILRHALEHDGATPEGFLDALGRRFLAPTPRWRALRLTRARAAVRAGARRRGGGAQRPAVLARRRRPRGRGARARARRRRRDRARRGAQRPGRAAAAQDDRLGVHALRPRRRDDAARARRPAAVHPPRRALALRRPGRRARRRPGALRRRRAGARRRLRRLPRVRLGVDPAPRARDGAAAAGALPGARGGLVRAARTTRTTPCPAPTPARTAAPTRRRSPPGA